MDYYYATYPNGTQTPLRGFAGTLNRGAAPDRFLLWMPVGSLSSLPVSSIEISGQTSGTVVNLTRCRPAPMVLKYGHRSDGALEHSVLLFDRRIEWEDKRWSGEFNVRHADGTVVSTTKKSLREIATALLEDFLGESSVDVSSLPNNVYPYVYGDFDPIIPIIDNLLNHAAADVSLSWTDAIKVSSRGTGTAPTSSSIYAHDTHTLDIPSSITVQCGDTWFQDRFELEAVGKETDGSYVPIDQLSYMPTGGWSTQWPQTFLGVASAQRHLALETVYRCYRVKELAQGGVSVPSSSFAISSIDQLLPVEPYLLDYGASQADKSTAPRATISGTYYPYGDLYENTPDCSLWSGEFTLDRERGIVKFEIPVFKKGSIGCVEPADLYLECAHRVRHATTGEFEKKTFSSSLGGNGPEIFLHHPELFAVYIQEYSDCVMPDTVTDNTSAIQQESDVYIAAWTAATAAFNRFTHIEEGAVAIDVNGMVQQASIEKPPGRPCITKAGVGTVCDIYDGVKQRQPVSPGEPRKP